MTSAGKEISDITDRMLWKETMCFILESKDACCLTLLYFMQQIKNMKYQRWNSPIVNFFGKNIDATIVGFLMCVM